MVDDGRSGPSRSLQWVKPPRQVRSQETLDRILDAAAALVAEKGFEDSPLQEIVRRAGTSVGAFYTRFRDKDGLLYALHERHLEEAIATTDDALDPARWVGATLDEVIHAVVRFLVSIYREQEGLLRAFVLRHHQDAEFRARQGRLSRHLNRRLAELLATRAEEIAHPAPDRAIPLGLLTVLATLEATLLFGDMRAQELALSDDDLARELAHSWLAYLGCSAGPVAARARASD
jgi:AcrR family transcriptional regulator